MRQASGGRAAQRSLEAAREKALEEGKRKPGPVHAEAPMRDVFEAWFAAAKVAEKWTASTEGVKQASLNQHCAPLLGHLRADELNAGVINQFLEDLLVSKSRSTTKQCRIVINQVVKWGTLNGVWNPLEVSPLGGVKMPHLTTEEELAPIFAQTTPSLAACQTSCRLWATSIRGSAVLGRWRCESVCGSPRPWH